MAISKQVILRDTYQGELTSNNPIAESEVLLNVCRTWVLVYPTRLNPGSKVTGLVCAKVFAVSGVRPILTSIREMGLCRAAKSTTIRVRRPTVGFAT